MNVANRPAGGGRPVTLICLAHAGGNVSLYREWTRRMPPSIRPQLLELPGRGIRRAAPALDAWPALIDQLTADALGCIRDGAPFAVFGHSMGALVGLELIHALRRRAGRAPIWFGASATVSPTRRALETHWLACTPEQMVARLRTRGGTPDALLDDLDFIDLMLPMLRADFHLCGVHPAHLAARAAAPGHAPLACPIDVFVGRDDPATANGDDVAAWSAETRGPCTVHRFAGGHFYLDDAPQPVLDTLVQALDRARAASAADAAPPKDVA
ncbi:thioesterase II family protein [Burkholderia alba]|uniref:thioesterase II family protein n=1 Tax=Burkholderia alba TaxID=2683677 RepID=UPI002B05F4AC|nr:alpha/beta fold hydrolase [Burkholderia alba]